MPLWEVTVMVVVPSFTPVTTPVSETVAMSASSLSQVKSVRSPNVVLAGTMLRVSVSVSPMATRWVSGMVKSCTGAMTVT